MCAMCAHTDTSSVLEIFDGVVPFLRSTFVSGGDSGRIRVTGEKGNDEGDEWNDQVQSTVQEGEYRLI